MYAEITLYNDDGTIKNRRPYVVPASQINVYPSEVNGEKTVEHKFTFVFKKVFFIAIISALLQSTLIILGSNL